MPYTLAKALVWLIVVFVIGIAVGWALKSAATRRKLAEARGEGAELQRLRERNAQLEPLVDERVRLLAELEASRSKRSRRIRAAGDPEPSQVEVTPEPAPAPVDERTRPADAPRQPLDLAAAAAVLGTAIEADDLKVIDGIGPKIEELCHGIGIRSWSDLAQTEVSLLRTMLTDAGARYKVHDPSSWPEQAALLAAGRWEEFKTLGDPPGDADSS